MRTRNVALLLTVTAVVAGCGGSAPAANSKSQRIDGAPVVDYKTAMEKQMSSPPADKTPAPAK